MNKAQVIKSTVYILHFFLLVNYSWAQSTFITTGSRDKHVVDRLAIKNSTNKPFVLTAVAPQSRQEIVDFVQYQDSVYADSRIKSQYDITKIDQYNYNKLLWSNTEYLKKIPKAIMSKKPFYNNFYTSIANLYEVNQKDLKLVINPAIQQVQGYDAGSKQHVYLNAKGLEMRGLLGNKIGFYAYVTDNQENGPGFYRQRVDSLRSVQGAGFYKPFKQVGATNKGQDYFDYRGYISFKLAKLINVQYGYDKNFIGNGQRSLFLSDLSAPTLFMKLNTKVWKLDYTNLFMELAPTTLNNNGSAILAKKYAAMHHLNINISENFSLGLFESVVFKRRSQFEFGYMVPVIFYRAVESGLGSGDNALVGADMKANITNNLQIYGQVILDEFKLSELKNKSWANKVGAQAGLKYLDAGGVDNLDFQFEWNIVRPFTYSHSDSFTTYTHYNQPLAHPLGANFSDLLFVARYQPKNKLYFESKIMLARQGQDTTMRDLTTGGGNIFRDYLRRDANTGLRLVSSAMPASIINFSVLGSYEIRPNLYLEGNILLRKFHKKPYAPINTSMITVGVRWNMNRRDFDY